MKIAVIGSGVSGIGATWALNEYSEHEIHLYEAGDYIGGHTHTVPFTRGDKTTNVDTGFIVSTPLASLPGCLLVPLFSRFLGRRCVCSGRVLMVGNESSDIPQLPLLPQTPKNRNPLHRNVVLCIP